MNRAQREPVMIGGLVTAVLEMFIMMAMQMGWITWDTGQLASFNNFIVALVALLVAVVPIGVAYFARKKVTPVADPRAGDGAKLVKEE